jgi:hypothetical protein
VVGESKIGGRSDQRAVTDVEGVTVVEPPLSSQRDRERRGHALDHEPVRDQRGVRARLHQRVHIAGVIDVVVPEEHPAHLLGLDQSERLGCDLGRCDARLTSYHR